MKINKSKYQILHLGQINARHKSKLGAEWLESNPAERDLEVLISSRLNRNWQCVLEAKQANSFLGSIKHSLISCSKEVIILLCSALVQPHLKHCVQFWASQFNKDVKVFEHFQTMSAKLVKGLEGMSL
ncbi:hypothetical protein WISP_88630 [Willisornis vidua]|uniref:Uncharacterized protein n=1 Tax=Willisornis vidua TaxID=1566151 RepID=A0ABQ9D7M2_9PASS|nr:hypothetical protein WISP_88630 [Willisornis vidua]